MIGVFYNGPSQIDGSPIVGIATDGSRNAKTGRMIQTWILRTDREPHLAAVDGSDVAICASWPDAASVRSPCHGGSAPWHRLAST